MKRLLLTLLLMILISSGSDLLLAQWVMWEQTNGPEGGHIQSLAEDDLYIYAATRGPVFRRQKNESTWTPLSRSAHSLAVCGTTLIAGTDGGGVFRSTDHGMTWERWISGLDQAQTIFSFAVNGNDLFAGTNRGVYLSADYGANWTPRNVGQNSHLVLSLIIQGSNLFAGTPGNGIYRSIDYATSWYPANNGLPSDTLWVGSLAVIGNLLFAGTWWADGVYRSTDNGTTWTPLTKAWQSNADRDINSLAILGTTLVAGTFGGVFCSENSGDSWTRINPGPGSRVSQFHISGMNLYAGTYDGVYFSSNAGYNWSPSYTGLIGTVINALLRVGTTLFAATDDSEALFRSDDNGDNWVRTNLDRIHFGIKSLASSGTDLFAGTRNGVIRSTDAGIHWSPANSKIEEEEITTLAVIPGGPGSEYLFAGSDSNGVFLSLDSGTHWIEANTGLTDTLIKCLAVNGTNLFAGTGNGVFLSTNYGYTWSAVNTGLLNTHINCLAGSGGNVFAGTEGGGVFISTNNGTNWAPVNTGLEVLNINCLVAKGTILLAGTASGHVFFSENSGSKWIPVEMGLRTLPILSLDISDTYLFAGIRGAGVYKCPLAGLVTSVNHSPDDISADFILEQNFPNPFRENTKIRFGVPYQTHVELKVFDGSGREVAVLVSKEFVPGKYEEVFDGKHLSRGVYYYQLQAGEFVKIRKCVLLK